MKSITVELQKNECVGDSVAKHNYNTLVLDTKVCNLSSSFFNISDNYKKYFDDYVNFIPTLTTAYTEYKNESVYRYKLMNATVNSMSPYWNKHEFTVQLNTNISLDYSTTQVGNYLKTDVIPLCAECHKYITKNYPASSFLTPTVAHVIGFFYNCLQPNINSHVTVDSYPKDFSESYKEMNVSFNKKSVTLLGMYIFSFTNDIIPNYWYLTRVLPDPNKAIGTFYPDEQYLPIPAQTIGQTSTGGGSTTTIKIEIPPPPPPTVPSKPSISLVSTTRPPRPCCGVNVGYKLPCCNATITINYVNPQISTNSPINLYYSTQEGVIGTLHSTILQGQGTATITNLQGNKTYYVTAVNDYTSKSETLTITTPAYV
jgi:hypothetical protein